MKTLLSIMLMGLLLISSVWGQTKRQNNGSSTNKNYSTYSPTTYESKSTNPTPTYTATVILDSIFTTNGVILANVKEVTTDVIKYTYPNEDVVNSLNKSAIYKIWYKSGRVQVFTEVTSTNITSANDWQKVAISESESDIKNLHRLETITVNLKGSSSKLKETQEKAYQSLKRNAAFLGGNVVYLLDKGPVDKRSGDINYIGVAYARQFPTLQEFMKQIGTKKEFDIIKEESYENGDSKIEEDKHHPKSMTFNDIKDENGNIVIHSKTKGLDAEFFRVTYYDISKIVLMWRDKTKIHNFIVTY